METGRRDSEVKSRWMCCRVVVVLMDVMMEMGMCGVGRRVYDNFALKRAVRVNENFGRQVMCARL
jgi:hypothetical protein